MKKLIQLFLLVFVFGFATSCSQPAKENKTETKSSDSTATKYQCPMKDEGEKTYDAAGTCPKCGMDLEKMK
ncbi:MAG: hypothetical protein NTX03_13490 [Bacteroidetes bacterium]|nr:hypothetical protein [Bacteroidota bacterium]